jgi:methyl-accepting chemotaxis protein
LKVKLPGRFGFQRKRLSVTTKIAIALCLLITFLMSALGTSFFIRERVFFEKEFQEKGWTIVHTLLQFTGSYFQNGDAQTMKILVRKAASYQDVSYVMFLDANGKVIASTDEAQVGSIINDESTKQTLAANVEAVKIHKNEQGQQDALDFFSPVSTSVDGSPKGYLRLGLSLANLNKFSRDTVLNIIFTCLAAVIAGIFLSSLITKKILMKPLSDLSAATEKLATGDFTYKVPIHNKDELGDLATAFNTMSVHLANLILSVKTSADDINKSAEQMLGRLRTSDNTNSRLSQTFDLMKQGTEEQVALIKQAAGLSNSLFDQSQKTMDCILQVLSEVNKTAQLGGSGISAISKIAASIDNTRNSLESIKSTFIQLEDKTPQINKAINGLTSLLEKNKECTVQIALLAARSGDRDLANTVESLRQISEESSRHVSQMSEDLVGIENTCGAAESSLDEDIKMLADGKDTVKEVKEFMEKVLYSLAQSKVIVEEAAAAAHLQSNSLENIKQSQTGIVDKLLKTMNNSSGAGSDTKLQMESLQYIDSLAKKMVRMVERLNVLSLQFKI